MIRSSAILRDTDDGAFFASTDRRGNPATRRTRRRGLPNTNRRDPCLSATGVYDHWQAQTDADGFSPAVQPAFHPAFQPRRPASRTFCTAAEDPTIRPRPRLRPTRSGSRGKSSSCLKQVVVERTENWRREEPDERRMR